MATATSGSKKGGGWWFRVPMLPRPVWDAMKVLAERTGLTHWQLVILGVRLISALSDEDLGLYARQVDVAFPPPVKDSGSQQRAWDAIGR
jgi:hypothetical protein